MQEFVGGEGEDEIDNGLIHEMCSLVVNITINSIAPYGNQAYTIGEYSFRYGVTII